MQEYVIRLLFDLEGTHVLHKKYNLAGDEMQKVYNHLTQLGDVGIERTTGCLGIVCFESNLSPGDLEKECNKMKSELLLDEKVNGLKIQCYQRII